MIRAYDLRTEHLKYPLGIDASAPRLSWKIETDRSGVFQTACQIQASADKEFQKLIWDSGKVQNTDSICNIYKGTALKSGERVYWRVKIWSQEEESEFSNPVWFEMGLLRAEDWEGVWIEPEKEVDYDAYKPARYLRKTFTVKPGLKKARAYMTAHGVYYFYLNGKLGTEDLFLPGFTSYYNRLQTQTYDITNFLQEGTNAWGIILGDGWWRGACGGGSIKNNFGYKVGFLGQLILTYADGSQDIIASDESFLTSDGPLLKTDSKGGEIYDARREMPDWSTADYDDSAWIPVQKADDGKQMLIASRSVPVRCHETFRPKVLITPNGDTVLDFGQNIHGRVEMTVEGAEGTTVTMVHTECLDKDGNFTQKNIQQPKGMPPYTEPYQENTYILKGEEIETYIPLFSAHGFRYVLVKGYPGQVLPENFIARAIYSSCEPTGTFTCSNEDLNKLAFNCRWTGVNNYVDVPTDCPTRERAGWLGDAQVFSRTAANFMDVYTFFEKWTLDIKAEQYPNGVCCNVAPSTSIYHNQEERKRKGAGFAYYSSSGAEEPVKREGYAGWGDACVIIPWNMYLCYGDKKILENMYGTAKAWVEYERASARERNPYWADAEWYKNCDGEDPDCDYIWDTKYHLGEWYEADFDIDTMGEFLAGQHKKGEPYLATAFYAYSTKLLSQMAYVLGRKSDAEQYGKLARRIKQAYNHVFVKSDGTIKEGRHAESIRALAFELVDKEKTQAVADKLNRMLIENGYHFNSGFLSTGFLIPVLCKYGYSETAFQILLQRKMPSWLYEIDCGATTVWEIWNGIDENGELEGSQCHYSPAAIANSFFTVLGGIKLLPEYPGYKKFVIHPVIGGGLTYAKASVETPYGKVVSGWKADGEKIEYEISVPPNTSAELIIPYSRGRFEDLIKKGYPTTRLEDHLVINLSSGNYKI